MLTERYKGYVGHFEFDLEEKLYFGSCLKADAIITFYGRTPEEAESAFKDSVDDYLEWRKSTCE